MRLRERVVGVRGKHLHPLHFKDQVITVKAHDRTAAVVQRKMLYRILADIPELFHSNYPPVIQTTRDVRKLRFFAVFISPDNVCRLLRALAVKAKLHKRRTLEVRRLVGSEKHIAVKYLDIPLAL